MRKKTKKLLAMLLVLSILLSLAACSSGKDKSKDSANTAKQAYGEVWSLASTTKILQDQTDFADKGAAELSYQAVKNEYESCQLMITAKKDIASFELKKADLKSGEDTFSAENIDVYVQKYVHFDDTSGIGEIPDPLVPMDAALEYEETTIRGGENGGLWVTVYVPEETKAGVYEGTFMLKVNSNDKDYSLDIPVSLEVYDYTLTDEVHAETLFSWRYDQVAAGEQDGSNEMMTYYYEFMQDYRISLESLPVEALTMEEYIEDVLYYYDRLTSYTILTTAGHIARNLDSHEDIVKEQILAIAAASTADKNLFDKAIIYSIDEPQINKDETRASVLKRTRVVDGYLQDCIDTIKADKTETYAGLKQIANWEESIREIPNVIPMGKAQARWMIENENTEEGQAVLNTLNCICPLFPAFEDDTRDALIALCEKYSIELWWYGCVTNIEPTPTYFVGDENLLSSRTITWLQKKYDVVGNLYWDVAGYTGDNASTGYNTQLYEWPDRNGAGGWQAGDGNLVYPGAAYGVYGPLPSLRLMSIRDGMEEYEILLEIENIYAELSDSFGAGFDVDKAMDSFYKTLAYNGVSMNADGENALDFVALRTELLQMVANLEKGLGFAMSDVTVEGGKANFTYFAQEGTKISIDGKEQKPVEGQKYEYEQDLEKSTYVEISVTNKEGKAATYQQYIATPNYILSALSEETVLDGITVSDGGSAEFAATEKYSTDGTSVHLTVKGVWSNNALANATFVPSASIATSLFGDMKLADFSNVEIDIYNPGESFNTRVRLYSGSSYADVGSVTIGTGKTTVLIDIKKLNFTQLDSVDRITFEFDNAENVSYEFYVDNVAGTK